MLEPRPESPGAGFGVVGELPEPRLLEEYLRFVKETLRVGAVRHSAPTGRPVGRVALCTGSGASLMEAARRSGCDLYITADLKYNDFMTPDRDFVAADVGHFESEYCVIDILFDVFRKICLPLRFARVDALVIRYIIWSKLKANIMATRKTTEVDYSMQEKIIALYELQKIDSRIDDINKVKGELPLEVQDLEDELAGLKTRVANVNAEIDELNTLTKQRKREVDQAKIQIANYKEQQNNVRNNREFESISKEIEYQELEIELAEKRLKEYAAGVKAKKAQLEEADTVIGERTKDLEMKRSELESIEAETASQVEELETRARQAQERIDERLLKAYERIRTSVRNGLAVVTVKRDACGGCFNRIPPQRQAEIRQGKKIIVCEYCGRILVAEPEADVE